MKQSPQDAPDQAKKWLQLQGQYSAASADYSRNDKILTVRTRMTQKAIAASDRNSLHTQRAKNIRTHTMITQQAEGDHSVEGVRAERGSASSFQNRPSSDKKKGNALEAEDQRQARELYYKRLQQKVPQLKNYKLASSTQHHVVNSKGSVRQHLDWKPGPTLHQKVMASSAKVTRNKLYSSSNQRLTKQKSSLFQKSTNSENSQAVPDQAATQLEEVLDMIPIVGEYPLAPPAEPSTDQISQKRTLFGNYVTKELLTKRPQGISQPQPSAVNNKPSSLYQTSSLRHNKRQQRLFNDQQQSTTGPSAQSSTNNIMINTGPVTSHTVLLNLIPATTTNLERESKKHIFFKEEEKRQAAQGKQTVVREVKKVKLNSQSTQSKNSAASTNSHRHVKYPVQAGTSKPYFAMAFPLQSRRIESVKQQMGKLGGSPRTASLNQKSVVGIKYGAVATSTPQISLKKKQGSSSTGSKALKVAGKTATIQDFERLEMTPDMVDEQIVTSITVKPLNQVLSPSSQAVRTQAIPNEKDLQSELSAKERVRPIHVDSTNPSVFDENRSTYLSQPTKLALLRKSARESAAQLEQIQKQSNHTKAVVLSQAVNSQKPFIKKQLRQAALGQDSHPQLQALPKSRNPHVQNEKRKPATSEQPPQQPTSSLLLNQPSSIVVQVAMQKTIQSQQDYIAALESHISILNESGRGYSRTGQSPQDFAATAGHSHIKLLSEMEQLKTLNQTAWQRLAELSEAQSEEEDGAGPLEIDSVDGCGSVGRYSAEGPSLLQLQTVSSVASDQDH